MVFDLTSFSKKCLRVWKLLKKPKMEEFKTVSKISAIGLGLIGVVGFAIGVLMTILQTAFNIQ